MRRKPRVQTPRLGVFPLPPRSPIPRGERRAGRPRPPPETPPRSAPTPRSARAGSGPVHRSPAGPARGRPSRRAARARPGLRPRRAAVRRGRPCGGAARLGRGRTSPASSIRPPRPPRPPARPARLRGPAGASPTRRRPTPSWAEGPTPPRESGARDRNSDSARPRRVPSSPSSTAVRKDRPGSSRPSRSLARSPRRAATPRRRVTTIVGARPPPLQGQLWEKVDRAARVARRASVNRSGGSGT